MEYKRNISLLKELKQDWNLQRIKNKEQYSMSIESKKHERKNQMLYEIERRKSKDLKRILKEKSLIEVRNQNLEDSLVKMCITKDWNKDILIGIIIVIRFYFYINDIDNHKSKFRESVTDNNLKVNDI